ncbi:hypothetical protein B0H17DRAFT_1050730, partial [Mycena rosella]
FAHLNRRPYLALRVGRLSMAPRILSAAITLLLALAVACAAARGRPRGSSRPPIARSIGSAGSFRLRLAMISFRRACVGAVPP